MHALSLFRLLVLTATLAGCQREQPNNRLGSIPLDLGSQDSVRLTAFLPRDTVASEDDTALTVYYYVVNGDEPIEFDNDPALFRLRVQRQDGSPVSPNQISSPAGGSWGDTRHTLPAGAVLGQVLNLRCIRDGAGYGGNHRTAAEDCLAVYDLKQPGLYLVIIEYDGPSFSWRARDLGNAAADTAGGAQRAALKNLRIADTASLMVVP